MSIGERTELLRETHNKQNQPLPICKVAEFLSVSRKSVYQRAQEADEQEILAKHIIDELHTAHPAWGSRQLSRQLKAKDLPIGRLKAQRYMNEMGIDAIYPKPNLSKANR